MNDHSINIVAADLSRTDHDDAILALLNAYSMDPMGDGKPLSARTRRELIPGLKRHPTTMVFLAYRGNEPIGLAICFLGFSTLPRARSSISTIFTWLPRIAARASGDSSCSRSRSAPAKLAVASSRSKFWRIITAPAVCMPLPVSPRRCMPRKQAARSSSRRRFDSATAKR